MYCTCATIAFLEWKRTDLAVWVLAAGYYTVLYCTREICGLRWTSSSMCLSACTIHTHVLDECQQLSARYMYFLSMRDIPEHMDARKKEFPLARRCPSLPGSNLPAGRDSPPSSSWNHQSGRTTAGGEVHHTSRKYWKEGSGSWCGLGSGLEADDREMMATLFLCFRFDLQVMIILNYTAGERDPLVTI